MVARGQEKLAKRISLTTFFDQHSIFEIFYIKIPQCGIEFVTWINPFSPCGLKMNHKDQIKSIKKALLLWEGIFRHDEPVGLKELIKISGLNKTTAHRLLRTSQALNLVIQDPKTKMYKLGPKLISLGLSALKSFDLHKEAFPLMKKLRDETGETVNLSILDGNDIVIIERLRSNSLFSLNLSVGSRLPAHCTSQGRAILAFLESQRREEILGNLHLNPATSRTILDKARLREELEEVRRKGYAVNREEFEIGIQAVAGPILNHDGEAVASMNVSFAAVRHPQEGFLDHLAEKVTAACRQLSFSLGYED